MASHGCPPGHRLFFLQEQNRMAEDCQPYPPSWELTQNITRLNSLNPISYQCKEPWKPMSRSCESNHFPKIDLATRRPVLIGVQETCTDSVLFSFRIAEQCKRHYEILQFLMSGSSEIEQYGLDLSLLSDLMESQGLMYAVHQQPYTPRIGEFDAQTPEVNFAGNMASSPNVTIHPDGGDLLTGHRTQMNDILSVFAGFQLSKNSTAQWQKQSILVPHFSWLDKSGLGDNPRDSLEGKDFVSATLTCPEKTKLKSSPKKKNSRKRCPKLDFYKRNQFHAWECLLSLMLNKQSRKTAILALKKSSPELPELLTQFTVGIAGTGLAVLMTIIGSGLGYGKMPFCASRLFSTGFGFGLVWLSGAVYKLRNAIVDITKKATKSSLKDEEIMATMDKRLKEIYFRALTVMAVGLLRFA